MDFKPYLSLLVFVVFAACAGNDGVVVPYSIPNFLQTEHAKQLYAVREQIYVQALADIKKEFKVSDADWQPYRNELRSLIINDDLFMGNTNQKNLPHNSDHWLIKEAKKVLTDFSINHNAVAIQLTNDSEINGLADQKKTIAGTIAHTLTLNPNWFAQYNSEEREALLRHEIMHFIQYDVIEENYIIGLLHHYLGHSLKQIDTSPAIMQYRKQRELKADLLALVDKPHLAKAHHDHYHKKALASAQYSPDFWKTHPSDQTRVDTMARLLKTMKATAIL